MKNNRHKRLVNDQNDLEIETREIFLLEVYNQAQDRIDNFFCSMKIDCDEQKKEIFAAGYMIIRSYTVLCRGGSRAEVREGLRTIGKLILQSNITTNTDIIRLERGVYSCFN